MAAPRSLARTTAEWGPQDLCWDELFAPLNAKLKRYFEFRGCHSPRDLAGETIARCYVRLRDSPQIGSRDLISYSFGIAKHVCQEDRRAQRRQELLTPLTDDSAWSVSVEQESVDLHILMEEALAGLTPAERQLLLRYYLEEREALCQELDMSPGALRVKVHRLAAKARHSLAAGKTE